MAWRYRWSGWGLFRIHTDKRGRQNDFLGEGAAKDREPGALLSGFECISNIVYLQVLPIN